MSADVAELRALANEVQRLADEVRAAAAHLHSGQSVDFHSRAAERYRHDLREQARRADGAVQELHDASRALFEHARHVEERQRQIAALERWFHDRVRNAHSVINQVANAGDHLQDAARREASTLVRAARAAPPPGSPEWDTFARRFGR